MSCQMLGMMCGWVTTEETRTAEAMPMIHYPRRIIGPSAGMKWQSIELFEVLPQSAYQAQNTHILFVQ